MGQLIAPGRELGENLERENYFMSRSSRARKLLRCVFTLVIVLLFSAGLACQYRASPGGQVVMHSGLNANDVDVHLFRNSKMVQS